MGIFRRGHETKDESSAPDEDNRTLEEIENSPDYQRAQESVNNLPAPAPSSGPFMDAIFGTRPQIVSPPEEEEVSD